MIDEPPDYFPDSPMMTAIVRKAHRRALQAVYDRECVIGLRCEPNTPADHAAARLWRHVREYDGRRGLSDPGYRRSQERDFCILFNEVIRLPGFVGEVRHPLR